MAHFLSPDIPKTDDENDGPENNRRPSLNAVRLLGSQLQDHPEACQRIASGSRLHDLEVRVRNVYDRAHGLSKLVRFRLSWEDDHIAVLSGASEDNIDAELHRMLVRLVRQAAPRRLDEEALRFTLRQIERRAVEADVPGDAPGVLDDESAAEAS